MQRSFKSLFKSYYICTVSLLNVFKITPYTTCFGRQWYRQMLLFVETAVLAFCFKHTTQQEETPSMTKKRMSDGIAQNASTAVSTNSFKTSDDDHRRSKHVVYGVI
jgi:hypothetical protein